MYVSAAGQSAAHAILIAGLTMQETLPFKMVRIPRRRAEADRLLHLEQRCLLHPSCGAVWMRPKQQQ